MRPRTWGVIGLVALVMAAVLLGITLIWQGGPAANDSATSTPTREPYLTPSLAPTATRVSTEPVTYTVKTGDTLSAIAQEHDVSIEALTAANGLADPDVLQVGQILIIPRSESTAPAVVASAEAPTANSQADGESIVVPPTVTPSGPPLVEITGVADVGNLESETITLSNQGGVVSLEAWTLSNPADDHFIFPALTLFPGGEVRVHSTTGDDTPRDLFWGRTDSAWQRGELVTLRDAEGNVVDTYIVPR